MRIRSKMAVVAVSLLLPAVAGATQSGIFRSSFTEFTSSGNATGIATGDFDGDGTTDVVTSNAGLGRNELNILTGFDDGTLVSALPTLPINSFPSGLVLADFDGDGIDDLIVALANENAVTFLKGRGDTDFFDAPGPPIAVDTSPAGMVAADITGDGTLDLVVANEGSDSAPGSVSFLAGNGDGTFTTLLQDDPAEPGTQIGALPTDLGTRTLAVGNIDADPGLDVLALNSRANSVSVFTGDNAGTFVPRAALSTGPAPQDLRLVDFNGDGKLDLAVATGNADAVTVQLGNGDRTFRAATVYPVGTVPNRLAVGDLDDDGTLDIVASNSRSGDVSLLRGDGMGGFGAARTFVADPEPQALTLADLDKDGLLDPIAATQGGDGGATVAVLRNRGAGVLQAVEDLPAGNGPAAVAAADTDDDGTADLIVAGDGGGILIMPARDGAFGEPVSVSVGGRTLAVLARDLNGDARPDLAVVDNASNRVAVLAGTGPNTFGPTQLYPVAEAPGAIASGDFNADGRVDLAVSAIGPPARVSVLLQQANGTFGTARSTTLEDEETPLGIGAVDANCDGRDDLVVANQATNTVSVLRSNGDGTFAIVQTLPEAQVGQGPIGIAVADFTRDGIGDFAVSNSVVPGGQPSVRVFRGVCDGGFTLLASLRAGDLVSALVARDFTGDQIVDIGLVNQTSNALRVFRGTGNASPAFQGSQPDGVSRMPVAIGAGDFDGDGRYDAVSANSDPSANNVSVLYNCARDAGCDAFGTPGPPGSAALRGDGNGDTLRSAADLVAVGREVMDGDGQEVEAIGFGDGFPATPGVDANGDGLVSAQDRRAVARRIFGGG